MSRKLSALFLSGFLVSGLAGLAKADNVEIRIPVDHSVDVAESCGFTSVSDVESSDGVSGCVHDIRVKGSNIQINPGTIEVSTPNVDIDDGNGFQKIYPGNSADQFCRELGLSPPSSPLVTAPIMTSVYGYDGADWVSNYDSGSYLTDVACDK